MGATLRTLVKICCIASVAEARLAVAHGAGALGLVSNMPSGPGPIPEARIAEIAATVPPRDRFGTIAKVPNPTPRDRPKRETSVRSSSISDAQVDISPKT